jgi:methylthioribose-1-phosphate isomerase
VTRESPPGEEPAKRATPQPSGFDPGRRSFFRTFGREAIHAAATVAGAADALRRGTTAAGAEIIGMGLGTPGALERLRAAEAATPARQGTGRGVPGELDVGFHSPYRIQDDTLYVLDQRRLPDAAVELTFGGGYELASAIRDYAAEGAPLLGQLAAYGLALTALAWRDADPEDRDGRLRVAAAALRNARRAPFALERSVERIEARWESLGGSVSGDVLADALRAEADAIATQATLDHARLGRLGAERLGRPVGAAALAVLTHGSVGALAGGNIGTALAVINGIVADGGEVKAWVGEGRPALLGARLTAWELAQAGVPFTVVADAAVATLLATGRVDVVLAGAERIATNGDTLNTVGTYPLAVLAARHGVPFYVCAPTTAIDAACPDGGTLPEEQRPGGELTAIGTTVVVPSGAHVMSPGVDVTPAELITALITEQGILDPPFATSLARAADPAARPSHSRTPA